MNMSTAGIDGDEPGLLVLGGIEQPDGDADQRQGSQELVGSAKGIPEHSPRRDGFAFGIIQGDEHQEHGDAGGDDGGRRCGQTSPSSR